MWWEFIIYINQNEQTNTRWRFIWWWKHNERKNLMMFMMFAVSCVNISANMLSCSMCKNSNLDTFLKFYLFTNNKKWQTLIQNYKIKGGGRYLSHTSIFTSRYGNQFLWLQVRNEFWLNIERDKTLRNCSWSSNMK